jgi:hypothetical protein
MEWTIPAKEPVSLSQKDGEEEDSREEIRRKLLPVSEGSHAPIIFYPPFPKSQAEARSRQTFRWSSRIALCIFLLLVACGSAYLILTPVGKGMLAGISLDLADVVTFFRS